MADPARFRLPKDVATLALMRDQLGDYLSTLERNTDTVSKWLGENNEKIVVAHHQLTRAVLHEKNEQKAVALLTDMKDIAGFVTSLQDFAGMGEKSFGADSAFGKALSVIQQGIPEKILERLPEIKIPQEDDDKTPVVVKPPVEEAPKKDEKWWSSVGSWFKNDEKNREKEREKSEAAAKLEADQTRRKWRQVQTELVSLQSDRHYYIDSFMDWVGENLAPSEAGADVSKVMERYQSPAYVISLAQQDYAEVVGAKADIVRSKALEYSQMASLLDRQEIDAFIRAMPALFPQRDTDETLRMKRLLLADFGAPSFASLALSHVKDRKDQFSLYAEALVREKDVDISTEKSLAFHRVLNEVISESPLDPKAMQDTLKKLRTISRETPPQDLINLKARNPFEEIAARFANEPILRRYSLQAVLTGLGAEERSQARAVVNFAEALKTGNGGDAHTVLQDIQTSNSLHAFMGLWHLCYPQSSLVGQIRKAFPVAKDLSNILDKAIETGILDELQIGAKRGTFNNVTSLFETRILPALDTFSPLTARKLLAMSFATGGLDELRAPLTREGGWIDTVMSSKLSDNKKLEWVAVLTEPYRSDLAKANILSEAAASTKSPETARLLSLMERNLISDNVRIDANKIMTNLDRIANVWYNPEKQLMKYTITGIANIFMMELPPPQAEEILTILKRRGGFESEYSGLFNPSLIDKFYTTPKVSKISWHRKNKGELYTEKDILDKIHSRPDFLHEAGADSSVYSVNANSILLVQERKDGTHLLVDKYGVAEVLDGKLTMPATGNLVKIGNAWLNPDNASVISFNQDKKAIEFRLEGADFDEFMKKSHPDDYFFSIPAGTTGFRDIETAMNRSDFIASPGGALKTLHFNLKALGYLSYDESKVVAGKRDTGFKCRKYSEKRPGFVRAEKTLADNILAGLVNNPKLIAAGSTITHKDCIDDAYYNMRDKKLYLFIGSEYVDIPCTEKDGVEVLKKLSRETGFGVVGSNLMANPNGVGTVEVPADVVNFRRATLLQYSDVRGKVAVTAEHESFPVNLDASQSHELFDALEEKGRRSAAADAVNDNWVTKLDATLQNLPTLVVKIAPTLSSFDNLYLLKQAMVKESDEKTPTKISVKEHFSVVSAKTIQPNQTFAYPEKKRARAGGRGPKP